MAVLKAQLSLSVVTGFLLGVGVFFTSAQALALRQCEFLITAGNVGLTEYAVASQISNRSSETICPLKSKGSIENLYNLLNNPQVIGGVVQSDIVYGAVKKQPAKLRDLQVVLPLEIAAAHLIVNKDSSYRSIKDIASGVTCVGTQASGSFYTSLQMKAKLGLFWVEANESFSKCLELLDRGSVDAVFTLASPPLAALKGKVGNQYRLLDVNGMDEYPDFLITQYAYGESEQKTSSFAVDLVFLVNKESIENDTRTRNKLTTGLSDVISNLDLREQDRICNKGFPDYGMNVSSVHRKACSMGYFGRDW
ncbi:TAXI family TRAP transporter solute-binding subunit [Terasakiella sp.]|uniref:TAXI family TRAP transporter solute-binding subunit n=1 Tax=Terasakiella sp. TaxID=2034861 RepID=UPI003AA8BB8E